MQNFNINALRIYGQKWRSSLWIIALLMLVVSGCGSKSTVQSFQRDDVDLSYISTIAVFPFQNNTKEKFAAEHVRDITITKILSLQLFDVVDKGIVDNALKDEAFIPGGSNVDPSLLQRIGARLNTKGVLFGTIDSSGNQRMGAVSYPELSLTLRIMDTDTGSIVWQASGNRTGYSFGSRLFGSTPEDNFNVAMKLLDKFMATIHVERDKSP